MVDEAISGDDATGERRGRIARTVGLVLLCVFAIVCVLLFFVERWLFDTWAALSMDEIIYHLSVSLEGTDTSTIWKFLQGYAPYALLVIAVLALILWWGLKRGGKHALVSVACVALTSLALLGYALADASAQIHLDSYLKGLTYGNFAGEDFIGENYVDPGEVDINFPEQKRNLVYIFLESMEMTYADEEAGGAFPKNLIPELTELAQEGECFAGSSGLLNGGLVFSGCDWTMGGMFAQTSGTPLKVPLSGFMIEESDEFFPAMVTMGDILADEGYRNELLIGSDAVFGGRESYFSSHGNYEIYDYKWALESGFIPKAYHVFWGFEDQKLFKLARQRVSELAEGDEPFNLTLLTVDTHFEDGYVCSLCDDEFGNNQYANVMACSSRQVSQFVEWLQKQDFYENTTIVLCGDHVTMDKDFCNDVPKDYQRRTYTTIINPAIEPFDQERTREYATFDLFPTTLAALGASISGDRLGIGTNLFSPLDTLVERYGTEVCKEELVKQSEMLASFSKIEIDERLLKRAAKGITLDVKVLKQSKRLCFYLHNLVYFEPGAIERAELRVTDVRTGETTTYEMKVTRDNPTDPNDYKCYVKTPFGKEDQPYLSAEVLMSVGEFEDYPIASLPAQAEGYEGDAGGVGASDNGRTSGDRDE